MESDSKKIELEGHEPPKEDVTGFVLKLVRGSGQGGHGGHGAAHGGGGGHEEEDKVEVDERWLMTYADKMTLIAGLFIMLFAMSKMDEAKLQKVKESAEKSFGKATLEKQKEYIDPMVFHKVEASERQLKEQVAKLTEKVEVQQQTMAELQKQIPPPKTPTKEKIEKTVPQKEFNEVVQQNKTLTQEKKELQQQITKIQAKVEEQTKTVATGGFVAFIMSWDTELHDVDLRIEDPNGKKFNFKNRGTKDYPGRFVIDTRRGPGTEVWQADRVLPGLYKFTYEFYNSYGNTAPCTINGTLFTQKGSLDIPKVKLDINGKKTETITVRVDEDGKSSVVK